MHPHIGRDGERKRATFRICSKVTHRKKAYIFDTNSLQIKTTRTIAVHSIGLWIRNGAAHVYTSYRNAKYTTTNAVTTRTRI